MAESVAVVGCVVRGDDPASLLQDAIGRADAPLAAALAVRGRSVLIVPVLSQPVPVSVALVEALVDLVHDNGAADVTVAAALTRPDRDRGHQSVAALAVAAGCTGRTPQGRSYDVGDLHERTTPAPVPARSVLYERPVAAAWVEAEVRILLCRNVSDAVNGFAGAIDGLLAVAPDVPGADPADVAADLLEHLPPTLAIGDATTSSHGPDGRHVLRPLDTCALLVALDPLRLDVELAGLQREDPAASRLVQRALRHRPPQPGAFTGDRTPFPGWVRAHPLVRDAARRAGAAPAVRRVLAAASGGPDRGAAPADPVLAALRSLLTPLLDRADDPAVRGTLVGLLGAVAAVGQQVEGWTATTAKQRVERVVVPLGFDPDTYGPNDYDGLPAFLAPLDDLLAPEPDVPPMRWRLLDGSVVFETSRVVAAPFAAWVARVDVAEGISLMADYVGGRRITVSTDGTGRPVRQAERNVYLPQPNYLAHWGGRPIDVGKIELVERGPNRHALHWRTVVSPNGSAAYDDGTLAFTDAGDGRTRVSVRGRQQFTLPAFWQAVDLDRVPEVKDDLVEDAYRRFFSVTFDNLEACYEGRPFRIGRDPDLDAPLVTQTVQLLLQLAGQWLGEQGEPARATPGPAPEVDMHGFRHFRGPA